MGLSLEAKQLGQLCTKHPKWLGAKCPIWPKANMLALSHAKPNRYDVRDRPEADIGEKMFLRTASHVIAAAMVVSVIACSTPAPASAQQAILIQAAVESLKKGDLALSGRDFAQASAEFDEAIRAVGQSYYSADVLDDTGTALTLALVEDSKGNHEVAANLRRNVLSDRLTLLRRKSRGS